MIGPVAINVYLVNQGVSSPTMADFPGFIGFTIILVVLAYFGMLVCAKIAQNAE